MREYLITGLVVVIFIGCSSNISENITNKKEFEGSITYKTILESKSPYISTKTLQSLYGDTMTLYIKNGNYKMTFNGDDVKEIYYLNDKNNQYTVRRGIDTLFVFSCDSDINQLVSSEMQPGTEKILNRQCRQLINNLGKIKNHYWFDPSVYINPDPFKKHKFGYVNIFYEKAQSVWLKYRYEGVNYNLTHTALKINEMILNDTIFKLPNLPEGSLE
ncbi:MAG TPA: hypothetical protein VE978_26710 [Chitinophagales bacterium]|nr:hypothetical protein [Chitinophagales bacterium]